MQEGTKTPLETLATNLAHDLIVIESDNMSVAEEMQTLMIQKVYETVYNTIQNLSRRD